MTARKQRHEAISDLLDRNQIDSQDQLKSLLEAEGIHIAQATLSRDLRALGVRKGVEGYEVSGLSRLERTQRRQLTQVLRAHARRVRSSGTMVVMTTEPGLAGQVAQAIDGLGLPDVLGTIAGRDTVFIAANSVAQASALRQQFSRWSADRGS